MKQTIYTLSRSFCFVILFLLTTKTNGQTHSIAREWNEALLQTIRNDYARPTVHARNLYHQAIVLHDAWAAYEPGADTFLLGKTYGDYQVNYTPITIPTDETERLAQQNRAICFAAYRLMTYRFRMGLTPAWLAGLVQSNQIMIDNGYNYDITDTDYQNGDGAQLGNYIGQQMIAAGLIDGANENLSYLNQYYEVSNTPLQMDNPGNPDMTHPNNWQQLELEAYIDQAGNPVLNIPDFLSPEWGNVVPFSLSDTDKTIHTDDEGNIYNVYHDPGPPPLLDTTQVTGVEDWYKWNFTLVSRWSSHHDPNDGVLWDISPASIGNIQDYPTDITEYPNFYDIENGGDAGTGHNLNPVTGLSYIPQIVPRGDYARVLAEFWADGPDSETPPGHWFTILNYVNDNPLLEKKWKGTGATLSDLEWDIKSYFTLGGAMHDSAITAWGCKGWYDYVRPVSAIRYMAEKGQSSDPTAPNFHPAGLPIIPGYIETVQIGDTLANNIDDIGKVKLLTWKGPDYITEPETDMAGVGWVLAENWWPYQRPSFVSPPFAAYVSGHSTYSRAAAEVLTNMTGSSFFPGGMGEFAAPQNEFLHFEEGPSVDVTLQWATYRDASDQCSLSRIWGGIHPPIDDMPGRFMGEKVGNDAFDKADEFFNNDNDVVVFNLQNIWLEGFYNTNNSLMDNRLVDASLIPNFQVYNESPWVYNGAESLTDYPTNFVDWIYVILRNENGEMLDSKACCLNRDGSIFEANGNNFIEFPDFDSNSNYIISIHHRNHLAIAKSAVSGSTIDFNDSSNVIGLDPTKLVDNKQMLYAGDFDGNGIINNMDYNIWAIDNVIVNNYKAQDADGNGIVNNIDYNLWVNNRSKVGELILRY